MTKAEKTTKTESQKPQRARKTLRSQEERQFLFWGLNDDGGEIEGNARVINENESVVFTFEGIRESENGKEVKSYILGHNPDNDEEKYIMIGASVLISSILENDIKKGDILEVEFLGYVKEVKKGKRPFKNFNVYQLED